MSTPWRYLLFVRERFPPGAYVPLIGLFVGASYVPSVVAAGSPLEAPRYAVATLVVGLAFLHLRMVDELKDADVDRIGRPSRPLARGLVSERDLRVGAVACLSLALALAASLGVGSLLAFLPAVGYMLLADAEFLAPNRIHRNLVVYAFVHSPVVALLLVFGWFAAPGAATGGALIGLALLGWGVGLGLEVTRKLYAPDEERPFVETYSSALGWRLAARFASWALAVAMLGGALYADAVGAGQFVVTAALVAAAAILVSGSALRGLRRATSEALGAVVGLAILSWPIGVALLFESARG